MGQSVESAQCACPVNQHSLSGLPNHRRRSSADCTTAICISISRGDPLAHFRRAFYYNSPVGGACSAASASTAELCSFNSASGTTSVARSCVLSSTTSGAFPACCACSHRDEQRHLSRENARRKMGNVFGRRLRMACLFAA